MRQLQWGEHTNCIDYVILNVNVRCLSLLLPIILCLWWLVTSLSPKRLGLDARSLHVGFVIDKMAVRQVFL
jgi:hypothetical protein